MANGPANSQPTFVFPPGTLAVLRLSQTFSYSVAGGATFGANRLGALIVPGGTGSE